MSLTLQVKLSLLRCDMVGDAIIIGSVTKILPAMAWATSLTSRLEASQDYEKDSMSPRHESCVLRCGLHFIGNKEIMQDSEGIS